MKNRYQLSIRFIAISAIFLSLLGSSFLLTACGDSKCVGAESSCTGSQEVETTKATLGESITPSFTFNYNKEDQLSPNREERVVMALSNRLFMAPETYGFQFKAGKATVKVEARKPRSFMPQAKNSMLWWARHMREYNCRCRYEDSSDEALLSRACSKLGIVNGILTTIGERSYCIQDKNAPDEVVKNKAFRTGYFARGPMPISGGDNRVIIPPNKIFGADSDKYITSIHDLGEGIESTKHSLYLNSPDDSFFNGFLQAMISYSTHLSSADSYGVVFSFIPTYEYPDPPKNADGTYPPFDCYIPRTNCAYYGGTCKTREGATVCKSKTSSTYCEGVCKGGELDGAPCVVPPTDKEVCEKKTDGKKTLVMGLDGASSAFVPVLQDGIAMQIASPQGLSSTTGYLKTRYLEETPPGSVEFSTIYYEPSAAAKNVYAVIDGQKFSLAPMADQAPAPNYTDVSKYYGLIYKATKSGLQDGCHKYYFVAETADGLVYTFPQYGSLGVPTTGGNIDYRNITDIQDPLKNPIPEGKCNSYYPSERANNVNFASSPATVKQCMGGETRPCYSGSSADFGGENYICKQGVETCTSNGYWSGVCAGEVLPKAFEVCGDGKDNNCDGHVDEGCPQVAATQGNSGSSGASGGAGSAAAAKKKGCSTTGEPGTLLTILLGALGFVGLARRRRS